MIIRTNPINVKLNMLTRIADSSLDYWLERLAHFDILAGPQLNEDGPAVIIAHYDCLATLIKGASALVDTQQKAAQLALLISPVVQAQGDLHHWLSVIRHAALGIYDPVFDDLVLTADLWRTVGNCYSADGDLARSKQSYHMAAQIVAGVMTEAGVDLYHELVKKKTIICVQQFSFEEAEALTKNLLANAYAANDMITLTRGIALFAYAYLQQYRFYDAFMCAQQAYIMWLHLGNVSGQARALHYMGEASRLTDSLDLADFYLNKAALQVRQFDEPYWHASLAQSLGALALEQHRYDEALKNIREARNYFHENGDSRNFLNSTQALGVVKSRLEEYDEAKRLLLEAADGWSWLGAAWKLAEIYYALGQTYAACEEMKWARVMLDEAQRMARSANVTGDSSLLHDIDEALAELPNVGR